MKVFSILRTHLSAHLYVHSKWVHIISPPKSDFLQKEPWDVGNVPRPCGREQPPWVQCGGKVGIGKARNLQGTYSFLKSLSALETGHAGAGLLKGNMEKGSCFLHSAPWNLGQKNWLISEFLKKNNPHGLSPPLPLSCPSRFLRGMSVSLAPTQQPGGPFIRSLGSAETVIAINSWAFRLPLQGSHRKHWIKPSHRHPFS